MTEPGAEDEDGPPTVPVWGAGSVVVLTDPPVRLTVARRIAGGLGLLVLALLALSLPVFGLISMGSGRGDVDEPVAVPAPTPVPTVEVTTVPTALGGTWQGRGYQTMGTEKTWTAALILLAGARTGRLTLIELGCSGRVAPVSSDGTSLRLVATMDHDPAGRCAPRAFLDLSHADPSQVSFSWEDAGNPENRVVGILVRL